MELLSLISLLHKFLSEFAYPWQVFKIKRLKSLLDDVKISLYGFKEQGKKEHINSAFEAIECILAYKTQHPQDFEDLCRAMKKFCQKRKNDKSIDEDILSLMK